jgi:hypothetical protein
MAVFHAVYDWLSPPQSPSGFGLVSDRGTGTAQLAGAGHALHLFYPIPEIETDSVHVCRLTPKPLPYLRFLEAL